MVRDRGRITIHDIVFFLAGMGVLAALLPVFQAELDAHAAGLSRGEELLVLIAVPLMLLVMLLLLYVKAVGEGV